MYQHYLAIGALAVNEIQCLINHRLLDGRRDGQVRQAQHQAMVAVR
jgi:hypothetical protein